MATRYYAQLRTGGDCLLALTGKVAILSNDEIEAMDEGEYRGWHQFEPDAARAP